MRFVNNELRYDTRNQMDRNGEALVQRLTLDDEHPVVFDVGGHKGLWAELLLQQADERGVDVDCHVFEPSSFSFARVVDRVGERASVHRLGLSDVPGTASLHVVRPGSGINSLVPFAGARTDVECEQVDVDTVDAFCERHGIDRVSLVKVDVEGHDLAVIRGAMGMLGREAIGAIQFEYNWRWVDSRSFLKDVFDSVAPTAYRIAKVTPHGFELYEGWHVELETFREANYLVVGPRWAARMPTLRWWGDE